jgi:hypothetical protein
LDKQKLLSDVRWLTDIGFSYRFGHVFPLVFIY